MDNSIQLPPTNRIIERTRKMLAKSSPAPKWEFPKSAKREILTDVLVGIAVISR